MTSFPRLRPILSSAPTLILTSGVGLPFHSRVNLLSDTDSNEQANSGAPFDQLDAVLAPYMLPVGILSILLGIAIVAFVIQILVSIGRKAG
ncbi:MAG: hypothetical protein Q7T05_04190 [Dehalococcoidia bacterium]|nr:hypothetical protein [Dehalococcoidia bacterium]